VNTKEEIQDDSINENGTSNAQKHERATSDCTQLVHAALGKISCEQLSTSEGEGFIYVFRDPKHADVVKIGYSKDVNRRTREHGQCDLNLTIIHISGRVKAMKRAEHLIKADLKHLRRPWKCSVCKRTHGEWFEVDEETAKARVTLWVDWINDRDPYDMDGNIDPLWKYLIEYGRKPRKVFGGKDHEARWEHWNWVLSDPLPKDSKAFQEHQKSFGSGRRRSILSQRRDGEPTTHTPQKHVVHDEGSLVGALSSLGVGQLVPGATQRATIGGTNWTLNINVMCGPHVSWEPNSANKPSQS
jgi:predicted GIY-YIG superfamily endonuclease